MRAALDKVCAVIGCVVVPSVATAQGSGPPILVTNGREIAAFFDGAQCAAEVRLAFRARSYDHFKSSEPIAARLMNNVTNVIRRQCGSAERVLAEGYVADDLSYTGIAARETDWRVVEIGVGGSGLAAGGERQDRGGKSSFAVRDGFVASTAFVAALQPGQVLCEAYEADTNTCRVVTTIAAEGADLVMRVRQLEDQDGLQAEVVSIITHNDQGFLCSDPRNVTVTLTGGAMGEASREALAGSLKARIEDVGDEACIGYAGADKQFLSTTFDRDDLSLTEDVTVQILDAAPQLRYDR